MANKNQLPRKKVFKSDQLLVFADYRIGALFPGETNICAEAFFQTSAFVTGLHDAAARSRDHHETCFRNFAPKFNSLLIFQAGGEGAGGAEHCDFSYL